MKHLTLQSDEEIISKPNLPDKPVKKLIVNRTVEENTLKLIKNRGIEPVFIIPNDFLPNNLKEHPDLNFFHYYKNTVFSDLNNSEGELSQIFDFKNPVNNFSCDYPADCLLNCVRFNKLLICNKKATDKKIINQAITDGLDILYVNQGYVKCSICIVDNNSLITDDISIYNQIKKFPYECLLIEKNSIRLKNYNYGFIGGCTGKIDSDKIIFNGSIMSHTNCNQIIDFLNERNIKPIELNNDVLTDVGSFIPITVYK